MFCSLQQAKKWTSALLWWCAEPVGWHVCFRARRLPLAPVTCGWVNCSVIGEMTGGGSRKRKLLTKVEGVDDMGLKSFNSFFTSNHLLYIFWCNTWEGQRAKSRCVQFSYFFYLQYPFKFTLFLYVQRKCVPLAILRKQWFFLESEKVSLRGRWKRVGGAATSDSSALPGCAAAPCPPGLLKNMAATRFCGSLKMPPSLL